MKERDPHARTVRTLAVAVLLLAGCAAPTESAPEGGASCGERFAGPPGDNAVLLETLQEEPDLAVERLLAVVGDETGGAPEAQGNALVWPTRLGNASFTRESDESAHVRWTPREGVTEDPAALLARALDAFLAPPEVAREGAAAWNVFEEDRVEGTTAVASSEGVLLGPLYEWAPRAAGMDDGALLERARGVADCLGVEGEAKLGPLQVVDGSVARTIEVGSGCLVRLDAATGSFIGGTPCGARGA